MFGSLAVFHSVIWLRGYVGWEKKQPRRGGEVAVKRSLCRGRRGERSVRGDFLLDVFGGIAVYGVVGSGAAQTFGVVGVFGVTALGGYLDYAALAVVGVVDDFVFAHLLFSVSQLYFAILI